MSCSLPVIARSGIALSKQIAWQFSNQTERNILEQKTY